MSLRADVTANASVGYSLGSATIYPSVAYAGRQPSDPLGAMGAEIVAKSGAGAQEDSSGRWGDYSAMSVDPTDDCTFWYTQEYYSNPVNATIADGQGVGTILNDDKTPRH
jgi:hypothetical protein